MEQMTLQDIQRCLNDRSEAVSRKDDIAACAAAFPYFALAQQASFLADGADDTALLLQSCFPEWTGFFLQGGMQIVPLAQRRAETAPEEAEPQAEPALHAAIDHFIADCSDLKPQRTEYVVDIASSLKLDESIATETLAKVYAAQHMYKKAVAVYRKLILKYPEKSSYFALQIETLEQELI